MIVGGNSQQSVTFDLTEMARMNQSICGVDRGTVEQLESLVQLFAAGKVCVIVILFEYFRTFSLRIKQAVY